MPDLSVDYLGVRFSNPIVVTACSLTKTLDGILEMAEAGAGGVITKTISAELLPPQETRYLEHNGMQFVPSDQRMALDDALAILPEAKRRTKTPIIANLISYSNYTEYWVDLAQKIEKTGVDMIELDLNAHTTADQEVPGSPESKQFQPPSIGCSPELMGPVVAAVKGAVSIPVITKLSPLTTDLIGIAKAAIENGTDGLSLLNASGAIPGLDIRRDGRPLYPGMEKQGLSSLAGTAIGPGALWHTATIKALFDVPTISGGGVMSGEQVIERILIGAHLAGIASLLYRDGIDAIGRAVTYVEAYLDEMGYANTEAFRGVAQAHFGASDFWAFSGATAKA